MPSSVSFRYATGESTLNLWKLMTGTNANARARSAPLAMIAQRRQLRSSSIATKATSSSGTT